MYIAYVLLHCVPRLCEMFEESLTKAECKITGLSAFRTDGPNDWFYIWR